LFFCYTFYSMMYRFHLLDLSDKPNPGD
jgi:hypothetical protein